MSTVAPEREQEQVAEPFDVPVVTKRDVLLHAAEIIDRDGWTRTTWVDENGRVCILGAVGKSALELGYVEYDFGIFKNQVLWASREVLFGDLDSLDVPKAEEQMFTWNDTLKANEGLPKRFRPPARVKQRLRAMAAEA